MSDRESVPAARLRSVPWLGDATAPAIVLQAVLLLVIVAGVVARIVALPDYVPDSGDEWGNTIAPFRILFDAGNPNAFFHPSLYYDITAAVYAALYLVLKATRLVDPSLSMTDLFVLDPRVFVFAARAVSVASGVLAMGALYALGKALWNRQAGLSAAALLAVLPPHAVYSNAVRVDSCFVAAFLWAAYALVRLLQRPDRSTYATAGLLTGLAAGANYNGALLIAWLVGAHLLRLRPGGRLAAHPQSDVTQDGWRPLLRALALCVGAFIASSPYLAINLDTSLRNLAFITSLSTAEHPGMEGRGWLFYATELMRSHPLVAGMIALSSLAIALAGTRTERFVLSVPIAYFVLFSLLQTKFDRFILPALALFMLVASGLPFVLTRQFTPRPWGSRLTYGLGIALVLACIGTMVRQSIPVPRHQMLAQPEPLLFDWIEQHVPSRSTILVESGILPLVDTLKEPGPFGGALAASILRVRPRLDHEFVSAVFVGGSANYGAGISDRIDYAIVSPRNMSYIESHCESFPDVCAFYADLHAHGRIAYQTPLNVEPAVIYEMR